MPSKKEWLLGSREDRLAMAKNWLELLSTKAPAWNVSADDVTNLNDLSDAAEVALAVVKSSEKTSSAVASCKTVFTNLVAKMRFVKKHYFFKPPLTDADFVSLGLKIPDTPHVHKPLPPSYPLFTIRVKDYCQVAIQLREEGSSNVAIPEGIAGAMLYCQTGGEPPASPETLPAMGIITRANYTLQFQPHDVGKIAYISLRWQNGRGEQGPWSPMQEIVVP